VAALHENLQPVALKPLVEELVERYIDRADRAAIDWAPRRWPPR